MKKINSINSGAIWLVVMGALMTANYATAQTCNLETTPNAPDHRYQDNADATVTDLSTGLMWRQCAVGKGGVECGDVVDGVAGAYSWAAALDYVTAHNLAGGFAGHVDWRLPNIKELRSLISRRCIDPAINENLFPNTPPGWYWSSSPTADDASYSWYVNFGSGFSHGIDRSFQHAPIRLVRTHCTVGVLPCL